MATERHELDRPAFYALASGGWRDLVTLLHPPYTAWHLSYVALGAAAAPTLHADRLGAALGAFFLAVGVSAHALDELQRPPAADRAVARRTLIALAVVGLAGAVAIGVVGSDRRLAAARRRSSCSARCSSLAYNLELAGGRFHTDVWFALAWGGFPAFTGYFAQTLTIRARRRARGGRLLPAERRPAPPEHAGARVATAHGVGHRRAAAHRWDRGGAHEGTARRAARGRPVGAVDRGRAARRRAGGGQAVSRNIDGWPTRVTPDDGSA